MQRIGWAMVSEVETVDRPSSSNPLLPQLHEILNLYATSVQGGDFHKFEQSISKLVEFLDTVWSAAAEFDSKEQDDAFEVLSEILEYIQSPSVDQEVIDGLSFELPKAIAQFSGFSSRFMMIADSIIDQLILKSNPRDMLSILCEALESPSKKIKVSSYAAPLLTGLSKVFLSMKRRQFEQIKVAVPIVIRTLDQVSLEQEDGHGNSEDGYENLEDVFARAIGIADSIYAVCGKLEHVLSEKLQALLSLYILQIMMCLHTQSTTLIALCFVTIHHVDTQMQVSISLAEKISSCVQLVSRLSGFFQYCRLSYINLITGSSPEEIVNRVAQDNEDDFMNLLSFTKLGASLSVIWGDISDEVAHSAKEDLPTIKNDLEHNQFKRLQAVGMLGLIFSSTKLSWRLKKQAVDFMLCIFEGSLLQDNDRDHPDFSSLIPSICAALQGVEMVIMYTSDPNLRKKAFDALKKVLSDLPTSWRFDILKALITKSNSPSMTAILLDLVKEEFRMENCHGASVACDDIQQPENKLLCERAFWTAGILDFVEFVLRPSRGGPPKLPEESDMVLSSLNLYRFVFITESTGNTNHTGVLSRTNLQKAYQDWLMPLRTLVSGVLAENKNDHDQHGFDTVCTLNPVELVLYRCIELVEERLKHHM